MKTDITAIRVAIADAADVSREIRAVTRRMVDPNRLHEERLVEKKCLLCPEHVLGHAIATLQVVPTSRVRTLRPGRHISPDEGKALHKAKRDATILCTIRAAMRGRVHSPMFLRSPALLEELAAVWRTYDQERVPIVVVEEEVAEVQEVIVVRQGE